MRSGPLMVVGHDRDQVVAQIPELRRARALALDSSTWRQPFRQSACSPQSARPATDYLRKIRSRGWENASPSARSDPRFGSVGERPVRSATLKCVSPSHRRRSTLSTSVTSNSSRRAARTPRASVEPLRIAIARNGFTRRPAAGRDPGLATKGIPGGLDVRRSVRIFPTANRSAVAPLDLGVRHEDLAGRVDGGQQRALSSSSSSSRRRRDDTEAHDRERGGARSPSRAGLAPRRELLGQHEVRAQAIANAFGTRPRNTNHSLRRETGPELQTVIHIVAHVAVGRRQVLRNEREGGRTIASSRTYSTEQSIGRTSICAD